MHVNFLTTAQRTSLVELYIAYFNRAPETDGLNYWTNQFITKLNAGLTEAAAFSQIADAAYATAIQFSEITGYTEFMTASEFVTKIYGNVLGRTAESGFGPSASEVNYWVTALNGTNPAETGVTRGSLILRMVSDAKEFAGHPTWGWVAELLANKVEVALHFAEPDHSGGLSGEEAIEAGIRALAGVTQNDATVVAANLAIDNGTIVNPRPVAGDFAAAGTEDGSISGEVDASDIGPGSLTFSLATGPLNGSVTVNPDGSYLFTPAANFNGSTSFTYSVTDGNSSDTGMVSLTVGAVNDAPVAQAKSVSATEDNGVTSTVAATDVDNATLSYAITGTASHGTVAITNAATGAFTYTPAANYNGPDSFTFTATDAGGLSSSAMVSVGVAAVNDAPVANAAAASGVEDTVLAGSVTASDIEANALTYSVVTGPTKGALVLNADGGYTYTPNANSNGADSFTYRVNDGLANSNTATVSLTIAAVNDAPVAQAQAVATTEDMAVSGTVVAADVDGPSLSYAITGAAAHGTVVITNAATGAFTYTPAANYNGADSFAFTATDSLGLTSSSTVSVSVASANDAPVAIAGVGTGNQDQTITGSVSATDSDGDTLSYTVTTQPANGSVSINSATGAYIYTPNAGFFGSNSFTFTVTDGNGGSSSAVIALSVADVADILTVGVDNVLLSGSNAQTVIGNDLTYNPGDNISGGASMADALSLGLAPTDDVELGSANVTGIEIFNVNVNPVADGDTVTLRMTNVSSHLTHINVTQSSGHDIAITDLQNLPRVTLDDVGARVTINVDNQVVAGNADALNIDVREFGTGSSSDFGRGLLVVDAALETITIKDLATSSGLASDISAVRVNGDAGNGFSLANITGGAAGVDLIVQGPGDVPGFFTPNVGNENGGFLGGQTAVASYGILDVNATTFLGDLVADVDGSGESAGSVLSGVGADSLTAHDDFAGLVNSGAGNDTILLSSANLQGTLQGADGLDTITVEGNLSSSGARIDGGNQDDFIEVTGTTANGSSIAGGAGFDTIVIYDNHGGNISGDDAGDAIYTNGGVAFGGLVDGGNGGDFLQNQGGDMLGTMNGGADADVIYNFNVLGDNTAGSNRGVLDGGTGDDSINQFQTMEEGSAIIGGDGNDYLYLDGGLIEGNLVDGIGQSQSAASITGGIGNDTLDSYAIIDGDVNMGDDTDVVTQNYSNIRTGSVDLGAGDDTINLNYGASFTGDGESGDGLANDGSIDGGTGANVMNVLLTEWSSDEAEIASDGSGDGSGNGTDIARIQTLNLNSLDSAKGSGGTSNDTFDINLFAFDAALTTINVSEKDDSSTVNLGGYDGEIINVDSDGDSGTDVNLNVGEDHYGTGGTGNTAGNNDNPQLDGEDIHGLQSTNETLTVNLNGISAYEVDIDDNLGINVTNLSSNGSGARMVSIDGVDQDNNAGTAGEGNSLNITGTNTSRLTVDGIYQETIAAAAYAGAVSLTVSNDDSVGSDMDGNNDDESLTITTGAGNDVVNILADKLNLADGVINMGGGTDRLIINEGTRLLSLVDEDQVFKQVVSVEELEMRGEDATNGITPMEISIEDDSRVAGIRKIVVTNDGGTAGNVDLDIDADYDDGSAGLVLTVEARSGVVDINNGADVDLDVNLSAASRNSSNTGTMSGSAVNFTQTGSGVVDVAVSISSVGTTTMSASNLAGPLTANPATVGHVRMDVVSSEIDSLTFNEADGAADAGPVRVTWSDSWAEGGSFTIDASAIANNDLVVGGASNVHTGGMLLIAVAENDVNLTTLGTANSDTIWGSQRGDSINGGDGNDWIQADPVLLSAVTPGTQMVKVIDFNEADDLDDGDTFTVTVGDRTYSWTASNDADTVATAVTALAAAINADQGMVDGDADLDVSAVANTMAGSITLTGVDLDVNFSYALGENIGLSGTATDRPLAVINVASDAGFDIGDVLTITVNGVDYSTTVIAGSTAATLATALAAQVDGHATLTASASGTQITLISTTANTAYSVIPSWTIDQLDVPATAGTVTVTYGDLEVGETASVSFSGGVTISAATTADLVIAINANGTLNTQWVASNLLDVLTLTRTATGTAAPVNAFQDAAIAGGDGGTATWVQVAGTALIDRTDNTNPTLTARSVSFNLADAFYDAGDELHLIIDAVLYAAPLPPTPMGEVDIDLTPGAAAAAIASGGFLGGLPAGYTVTAVGSVVTVTAPDNVALPTWSLDLFDVAPAAAQEEIATLDYTGFVAGSGFAASALLGAVTYAGATVVALQTAINAATATHGYIATLAGDVITLTSANTGDATTGEEPAIDKADIAGLFTLEGGPVPAPVVVAGDLADPATETIPYATMLDADGAQVVIGMTTYFSIDVGTVAQTLAALVGKINVNTGTHGWVASVVGTNVVLTGPANGTTPAVALTSAAILPDGGVVTAAAATSGVPAVTQKWTVTAPGFDQNAGESVSVTFDTDGVAGLTPGDITLAGDSWADLAATINAYVALGGNLLSPNITGAVVSGSSVIISGPADGTAAAADQPVLAGFAGTGGPAAVSAPVPGAVATPWSQVVTVNEVAAGETVYVILSNGTVITQVWNTDEVTTLTLLAGQITTAITGTTSAVNDVANTITLTGAANGSNPASSVATTLAGDILAAAVAVVSVSVPGDLPSATTVAIDYALLDDGGELAVVNLAAGLSYSATSVAALVTAVNAATLVHGWTASNVLNVLTLTGPANGTAPLVAFVDARLIETDIAVFDAVQESWHNLDNNTPTLMVVSGNANTAPTVTTTTAAVAAATAATNGNDTVNGGNGDDTIIGLNGTDNLNGDAGNDNIDGGNDNDTINGGDGNDMIVGGMGADILNGNADHDTIIGGDSTDTISGGEGNNRLFGGDGNDTITAGSGNDFIRGGAGKDLMTGGNGSDTFYFAAIAPMFSESQGAVTFADVVTDFVSGTDKFQFEFGVNFYGNMSNATNLLAGLTDSSLAAGPAVGRAFFVQDAKLLFVDVNGDGAITVSDDIVVDLNLAGVTSLTAGDFLGGALPPVL